MSYHPRFETTNLGSYLTTRTRNSELWFVNNKPYEDAMLGYAAKYCDRYSVELYGLAIEGNHIHQVAKFPKANRAHYMRDLNSMVARAAPKHCSRYSGGKLWGRRYSCEIVPDPEDIEEKFFYTVLQALQDNLTDDISKQRGYNCFHDAVWGIEKEFTVVRWGEYNDKKRFCKDVKIEDFTDVFKLRFKRIPGYEQLSQSEYAEMMYEKLRERQQDLLKERAAAGKKCPSDEALAAIEPGTLPKHTKKSTRDSHRPRALCVRARRQAQWIDWYFRSYSAYKEASLEYRRGNLNVEFPPGTYKPPLFTVACTVDHLDLAA